MTAEALLEILKSAATCPTHGKSCPLAFSGGLDSAILAAISNSPLYSIGLAGCYDLKNSEKVAAILGKELAVLEVTEEEVIGAIPKVAGLVGKSQLDIEIGVPFYLLFQKLPQSSSLVTGQGADELFGGYKRYERLVGTAELKAELKKDAEEVSLILERRELIVAESFGIILHFPYLDPKVVGFAKDLPAHQKVSTEGRKLILREVGKLLGLPAEVYRQPKKAIQYGTGISKLVKKNLKEISLP